VGRWVVWVQKRSPPKVGGEATLPAKAVRRYVFLWVGCGKFSVGLPYLCGMATLQVGDGAAKAVWRSVPVSGRSKATLGIVQTPPRLRWYE
jgi:hypothetical protein